MINNEIRDWQGALIGFRCTNCGETYQSGFGAECNHCARSKKQHSELISEIKKLKQVIGEKS